jgi:two-component system, OmpR family, phosphate regulon sensor histidine kinase PhoR
MVRTLWRSAIWSLTWLITTALVVGLIVGEPLLATTAAIASYLAWQLYQLYRLHTWLASGRSFHPPIANGIWGEVFRLLGQQVERHRQRKRRLAALLQRVQEATSAMPDAIIILGPQGDILWFNDAAHDTLGLQWGKDLGQRLCNLILQPQLSKYLHNGDHTQPLLFHSPRDDQLLLSLRIVPYNHDQRLLIARDVTIQQRLEQTRRTFIANVSHELRTPLTVLVGFLETLRDSPDGQRPPFARSLELMDQQAKRMQNLVDDLLMLSRLESGQEAPREDEISLENLFARLDQSLRPLAERKQQRITLTPPPENTVLIGSEKEIFSAFSNLITNAIRYTQEKGEIDIWWETHTRGSSFNVRDSGPGIAPIHLPRLTERFYRADIARSRESGGTGLGLAIVKHVLNRHEAWLGIKSQLGEGSTFSCHLPPSRIQQLSVEGESRHA